MTMPSRVATVSVLALALSFAPARTVHGDVPTSVDFLACNQQAPQAIKAGHASPTTNDHVRAERARAQAVTSSAPPTALVESADPQVHGMEAEGARNAAYQAAYRSCMRRKGF
jgi:hypothetical protein